MPLGFFGVAGELRNMIYLLCLTAEEPLDPCSSRDEEEHKITAALLRTNKTVYQEANALLYSKNRFCFTRSSPEQVVNFITKIGPKNASLLREIFIAFPQLFFFKPSKLGTDPEHMHFDYSYFSMLAKIQSGFTSLDALTLQLKGARSRCHGPFLTHHGSEYSRNEDILAIKAVKILDGCLRSIPSLKCIVVESHERYPACWPGSLRGLMLDRGWRIIKPTRTSTTEDAPVSCESHLTFVEVKRLRK